MVKHFGEGGQAGQSVFAHSDPHPLTCSLGAMDTRSRKARLSSLCVWPTAGNPLAISKRKSGRGPGAL